jgi:hypothetical protein
MFDPSTWNCTLLMAALSEVVALTMTVPEIATPELGEVIDTLSVPAGRLFELVYPAQPEIARQGSATNGHARWRIFRETLSRNRYEFIIRTLGFLFLTFRRRGRPVEFSFPPPKLQNRNLNRN